MVNLSTQVFLTTGLLSFEVNMIIIAPFEALNSFLVFY